MRRLGDPIFNRLGVRGQPWGLGRGPQGEDILAYTNKVLTYSPEIHLPFDDDATDESGNGNNGAPTDVTFNQSGIGDGRDSALFNGTSSKVLIGSLIGDSDEYSWVIWAKLVDAAAWQDDFDRLFDYWQAGANSGSLAVYNTDGFIYCNKASGVYRENTYDMSSDLGWHSYGVTASILENRYDLYVDGSQVDTTTPGNGALADHTSLMIGASVGSAEFIHAYLQHAQVYWGANILSDADHGVLGVL